MPIGDSSRPTRSAGLGLERGPDKGIGKGKEPAISAGSSKNAGYYIGSEKRIDGSKRRRGFWGAIFYHFRRFWLCYGLAGFIFLAIFLPVFFLVIFPAIAQRLVDNYHIPIYSAEVIDPTPSSITFSLSTALNVPLGLSVRIDPFNLSLYNKDVQPVKPYVIVPIEGYTLKKQTNITVTNQTTRILNEDEFTNFLAKSVYSKTFTLSAEGSTMAHLGALKAKLNLKKDIEINGLDMLKGFSINSASLALPPESDGSNLVGEATLPNYSVVTFGLGNVTLNLLAGGITIGQGKIENVFLKPGNNTVPLRGVLDIKTAVSNIGKLLAAETSALGNGNLALTASGNSTVYNGLHIPYFETVLNNLTITAQVPILQNVTSQLEKISQTTSPEPTRLIDINIGGK